MVENTLIFAEDIHSGNIYEVLSIELWQGEVNYLEILNSTGEIMRIDDPRGYKYTLEQKFKEIEYDSPLSNVNLEGD